MTLSALEEACREIYRRMVYLINGQEHLISDSCRRPPSDLNDLAQIQIQTVIVLKADMRSNVFLMFVKCKMFTNIRNFTKITKLK